MKQNPPTNFYSELIHQHSIGGLAYGFAYDDNCNRSSYTTDNRNPTSWTITIPPF